MALFKKLNQQIKGNRYRKKANRRNFRPRTEKFLLHTTLCFVIPHLHIRDLVVYLLHNYSATPLELQIKNVHNFVSDES